VPTDAASATLKPESASILTPIPQSQLASAHTLPQSAPGPKTTFRPASSKSLSSRQHVRPLLDQEETTAPD
jgi:hypothetical protein